MRRAWKWLLEQPAYKAVTLELKKLLSNWLAIAGFAAITYGVCLFLLPLGLITGGLCALLFEWYTDDDRGGRR
jgi:hypothetical protein